jgi:hypothetical protein
MPARASDRPGVRPASKSLPDSGPWDCGWVNDQSIQSHLLPGRGRRDRLRLSDKSRSSGNAPIGGAEVKLTPTKSRI